MLRICFNVGMPPFQSTILLMAEMIVHRSRHSTGFGYILHDLILVRFFSSVAGVVGCLI